MVGPDPIEDKCQGLTLKRIDTKKPPFPFHLTSFPFIRGRSTIGPYSDIPNSKAFSNAL